MLLMVFIGDHGKTRHLKAIVRKTKLNKSLTNKNTAAVTHDVFEQAKCKFQWR